MNKFLQSAVFFCIIYISGAFAQDQSRLVSLSLDKQKWTAGAGTNFTVVLHARIGRGWHINSNKPNDEFLIPAVLTSGNPSFPLTDIAFPVPKKKNSAFPKNRYLFLKAKSMCI